MRKVLLVVAWFPVTIVSLIITLYAYNSYSNLRSIKGGTTLLSMQAKELYLKNGYQFYASLPEVLGSFTSAVEAEDARPEILRQFMQRHKSPMEPYAEKMVQVAEENSLDFRLIPAIAMCESNLGKRIPEDSYNAFGYAIYTGQTSGAEFDGWDHALEVMGRYLASKYYSRGLTEPEDIGPIYAPPSVNTGNSWAKCVRSFMDELQ